MRLPTIVETGLLLLSLLLGTAAAGPVLPPAERDAVAGTAWWPQPRARAALLFVADARGDARLPMQAVELLHELGFSVMLLEGAALDVGPALALGRVGRAWAQLRQRQPGLPLVLAGHGSGATLAIALSDELVAAERPQLLWLLAPGRSGAPAWASRAGLAEGLIRPDVALARVDALCIGQIERATRVLVLHGDHDPQVTPEQTRALVAAAPEATVLRIRAAGRHDLLEGDESRTQVKRLLNGWLNALRRAAVLRSAGAAGPG